MLFRSIYNGSRSNINMPIESLYLTKSVVNRDFLPNLSAFCEITTRELPNELRFFHLKMNVKNLDDLNICRTTYYVNVNMFGEISASRSIRLIPLHFVTDEHMSIHTAL